MSSRFVFLFFLIIVLVPSISQAQGLGNSPYSRIGIGDLYTPLSVQNLGSGGVSVAPFGREYIHLSNPAASVNKKGLYVDSLVKFEGAFTSQYKVLSNPNSSETFFGTNFRYFALSVPVGKVWNTTLSMQPFSVVDHSFSQTAPVVGDPSGNKMKYTYDGKGGIYQIALNNGWGVSKSLSLGLGASYLFGPSTNTTTSVLITNPYASIQDDYEYGIRRRVNHQSFGFKPSGHYRKEFYHWKDSVLVPSGIFWNIGATAQFYTPLQLSVNEYSIRKSSALAVLEDSLIASSGQHGNLPAQFTGGFSIDKPNRWMVGVEGGFADWSGFSYGSITQEKYKQGWNISLGGEYRPVTRKQWRAWTYRAGISYVRLPYVFSGKQLSDFSGSLGLTLPVGVRGSSGAFFPKINLALVVGQRGTSDPDYTKEVYARLHFSILITDKWFIKRRIQ